jgi:hypothetical protein
VCEPPNRIKLSDDMHAEMGLVRFSWVLRGNSGAEGDGLVSVPVYLYANRADFLFCLDFNAAKREESAFFIERGVAVVCNRLRQ